jgi:uncharacterized membrane protein
MLSAMSYQPSPSRLESFSDGVIAVIITIMVLEFKVPQANGPAGLRTIAPTLAVYLLSFSFTGIYWINHHHLVSRLKHVDNLIMWANLGLLFFLSLLPFFTDYMVVKGLDSFSVALYVASLLMSGVSFMFLQKAISRHLRHTDDVPEHELALHRAEEIKGKISLAAYAVATGLAYIRPALALVATALVTVMWIVPTLGLEKRHNDQEPIG